MSIQEGLQSVDAALKEFYCAPARRFHLPRPLQTLEPAAVARALATDTIFAECEQSCGVGYREGHHEIMMWHFALLFAQYVAGMLVQKGHDGHCYQQEPCALARDLHIRMLARFKADLQSLVNEIGEAENAVSAWPQARPHRSKP